MSVSAPRLPAYALFAALLSAAGLPIYIHAPKFYVDEYGVSLAALGTALFGLRLLDVVQDPLLGRLSDRLRHHRALAVGIASTIMGAAMVGLFAVTPPFAPLAWFALMLGLVFSAFSFLTICFYAQGVATADVLPGRGYLALARWRETGALLGVCVAAVAPVALGAVMARPFTGFAVGFVVLAVAAVVGMAREWRNAALAPSEGFGVILRDPLARRLLIIAFVNAAPVAFSSTLFLFYVESALGATGWEGALLLLFFLSAAIAAPFWGMMAERYGAKRVLIGAMMLNIAAYAGALFLGQGDVAWFALICLLTGAALSADLTILPAVFANRLAQIAPAAAEGFGLWSFVSKLTLAVAAVTLLPALEAAGFNATSSQNPKEAIDLLVLFYAGLPCVLKGISIVLLARAGQIEER